MQANEIYIWKPSIHRYKGRVFNQHHSSPWLWYFKVCNSHHHLFMLHIATAAAWSSAWPQPRTRQFVIRERCRDVVTARTIAGGDIVPKLRGTSQGVIKDLSYLQGILFSNVLLSFIWHLYSRFSMKCLNIIGIYCLSRTGEEFILKYSPLLNVNTLLFNT